MSRNTSTVNHNYTDLCSYQTNKMKCIVRIADLRLMITGTDVTMLLEAHNRLDNDSKVYTLMDYRAYLELHEKGAPHFQPEIHHADTMLVPHHQLTHIV